MKRRKRSCIRARQRSDRNGVGVSRNTAKKGVARAAKRRKRRQANLNKQTIQAQGRCPKHLDAFVNKQVVKFANGTMHVEQRCATCNGFIKWGE